MRLRIGAALLIGLALTGSASALFKTTSAADGDDKIILPPPRPASPPSPAAAAAAPVAPKREAARRGNPLWGMPLRQFTAAVDRPLFAPTRRPPPPPSVPVSRVAPPPPPPAEPEKPPLLLVGTVALGDSGGIGLFIDQTAKTLVRLKMGDAHQGWTLRVVARREVVLEKAREKVVLTLPPPDTKKNIGAAGVAGPIGAAASLPPVPPAAAAPPPPGPAPQAGQPGVQQVATEPTPAGSTPFAGMLQMLMNQRQQ